MNTLCWSLTKNNGDTTDFFPYMYDLFYLSMIMAKKLGYKIVLYGNSNAIRNLKELCDEVINIDGLDYQFFDDPKVYIWATRDGDYTTIDGDVFLYERLNFREDYLSRFDLRVDKFQPLNDWDKQSGKLNYDGPVPTAWRLFNEQNPEKSIHFWNRYTETDSYNTGIVHWDNEKVKRFYVQHYYKLRQWYINNRPYFEYHSKTMRNNVSISSHFICEHLMRRVAHYFNLNVESLKNNGKNSYTHLVGSDKFTNADHWLGIKLLVERIKQYRAEGHTTNFDIKGIYIELSKLYGAL
jgi:hypothetical protein